MSVPKIAAILLLFWLVIAAPTQAAPCNCSNAQAPAVQKMPQGPVIYQSQPVVQVYTVRTRVLNTPAGYEWVRGPLGALWMRPVRQVVASNQRVTYYQTAPTFRLQQSSGGCANGNCPAR